MLSFFLILLVSTGARRMEFGVSPVWNLSRGFSHRAIWHQSRSFNAPKTVSLVFESTKQNGLSKSRQQKNWSDFEVLCSKTHTFSHFWFQGQGVLSTWGFLNHAMCRHRRPKGCTVVAPSALTCSPTPDMARYGTGAWVCHGPSAFSAEHLHQKPKKKDVNIKTKTNK